ncbi:Anticodon-binding [Kalmanozyma brasiliensis GHG001]|uniref:proline--tRNA ligase n=1 Tax=Kalmanozyma brasiliensis (strain GHG001) TaxID=1365824 RepID=V5EHX7_KALBG|nr:Anticodon-binding [Kalmanozyma brasiliensis GHG001]EST10206.1 Anticodon-binding [Kalmanozyma brasiliensis GHG001]
MEAISSALSALSIQTEKVVKHAAANSPESWRSAVSDVASTLGFPTSNYTKTVVFKPKTAKTATPTPVVLIAKDDSEYNTGAVAKHIGQKEMRLAAPEVLKEFLNATKDDVSALSITKDNASQLIAVLDASLATSTEHFAVHAASSEETLFMSGAEITKYLQSTGVKLEVVDFAKLKAEAATPVAKASAPSSSSASAPGSTQGPIPASSKAKAAEAAKIPDAEQIGITVRKAGDFSEWYSQVLRKGDMLDYYDVSGCYILKPWSYFVWQSIQNFFDAEIKKIGVENCYFPMFVSADVLEREKDHIEGFAPEVAWVTKAGNSDLERPVAIRPTSETVMYPYYAKWIQSHRDLPLKLNQWNSVVRWEFKHPQPFLRTREFLWQEGHTAHMTLEQADEEVMHILDLYRQVYEKLLAVPVVPGVKSEKEKFAGGYYTTTVEGFVPTTGRGIQGGTSHCLGQNFSKMFNITVEDPKAAEEHRGKDEGKLHVWQNSWGLSTRTIGVMVMVHGDDDGLVMPPRVAQVQVVIIPCGIGVKTTPAEKEAIMDACDQTAKDLKAAGIRAKADLRDNYSPGFKFNDWEMRGVPIRLEIGPKDLEKKSVVSVRRDNKAKAPLSVEGLSESIAKLLDTIHDDMFAKADAEYRSRRKVCEQWDDFTSILNDKCHVVIPWCEVEACEDEIKKRSARQATAGEAEDEKAPSMGAKSLCIPFDQKQFGEVKGKKCPQCGKDAKRWTMFGRSY